MDNYHYPLGADTEEAPWNQKDTPEKEFDVTCTICIRKTVPCFTNDYIPGAEYIEHESDDSGDCVTITCHEKDDTSDTNWCDVFNNNHRTIPELLKELKKYIQKDLDNIDKLAEEQHHDKAFLQRRLEKMLEDCDDWVINEEDYEGE